MKRWLMMVALWPLLAATAAHSQSRGAYDLSPAPPERHARSIDLRLVQEPSLNRIDPPSTGFQAETEVGPNARLSFRMMTVSRPKLGPEWRVDGRSVRSRKPAVSLTWRF